MRWRGPFVGLVGVFVAWLVVWLLWTAWWLPRRSEAQDGVYVASGYLDAVALFLRHDWLAFDPAKQEISLAPGLDGTPAEEFFEESYLEDDVAAFNAGDLSVFRVENGRILAIDPHRRNVVLPFTEARSWQGRLTFRPAGTHRAELRGAGAEIELTGPSAALAGQLQVPRVVLAGRGREGRLRRVSGEAVNVVGEGGVYLGQLHLVGDAVVFNYRNLSPGASVSVSGERVPLGNRVRLGSGDLLKLEWRLGGRQSTYALLTASVAGPAPVISSYRAMNGRWQRWPEHPDPPYAADVVAAMDAALRRRGEDGRFEVPTAGSPERLDLALTLDGRMQREIEERLARFVRSRRQPDEPAFRAAVTVMDVASGDLLALASFPQPEDLPQGPDASPAARRLLRNHNLARLPIGSVAKVPFAAAILDAAPVLKQSLKDFTRDFEQELRFPTPWVKRFAIDTLDGVHIGNFVEVKASEIASGSTLSDVANTTVRGFARVRPDRWVDRSRRRGAGCRTATCPTCRRSHSSGNRRTADTDCPPGR